MDNIDSLGTVGERVKVADGYARNYLIPQGLAVHASKAVERQLEARKAQVQKEYEEQIAAATEQCQQNGNYPQIVVSVRHVALEHNI